MIEIHKPLGRLDLYVDHYETDEVIDLPRDNNLNEIDEDAEIGRNENEEDDAWK